MARSKTANATQAPEAAKGKDSPARTDQPETVTMTGRLCADPVLRHTNSGKSVTTIRLAVNTPGAEAKFHDVVVWNRNAEVVCEYLRKGRAVEVSGRLQQRSWEGSDGDVKIYTVTELIAWRVQFLRSQAASSDATPEKAVA
jgi:single-strand DNA-binding protein